MPRTTTDLRDFGLLEGAYDGPVARESGVDAGNAFLELGVEAAAPSVQSPILQEAHGAVVTALDSNHVTLLQAILDWVESPLVNFAPLFF